MDLGRMRQQAGRVAGLLTGALERSNPAPLRVIAQPILEDPLLIAAFEGWSDAGESASLAAAYLARRWEVTPFAEIDPEEFFDFTEVRPEVRLDGARPRILWPATTFSYAKAAAAGRDVILMTGHEPQLKWRNFAAQVVEVARLCGVERVVALGAYLAEVTHDQPVPVSASSSDPRLYGANGIARSTYDGPTGILGVLQVAFAEAGIASSSLWASVPAYSFPVSAKAALALVHSVTQFLGKEVNLEELEEAATEYEERMDELVADDENVAAYVERLAAYGDNGTHEISADGLAEEIERYLRNKPSN